MAVVVGTDLDVDATEQAVEGVVHAVEVALLRVREVLPVVVQLFVALPALLDLQAPRLVVFKVVGKHVEALYSQAIVGLTGLLDVDALAVEERLACMFRERLWLVFSKRQLITGLSNGSL